MQPIKNPIARFCLYIALVLFMLYSCVPFLWVTLQSLKTPRQANSRTPLLFFEPTVQNYGDLWLDSTPENFGRLGFGIIVIIVILALLGLFARYIPLPNRVIYWSISASVIFIIWAIPKVVNTAEFYDYFVNSLIVSVGVVIISISIGSLSAYALSRYSGMLGVVLLLSALAFRSLPRLGFLLPYFWLGQKSGLYDTHFLVIITLVAVTQPFTIWILRSFFMDIPREIEEAAMIDGAGRFEGFVRVIIPIAWPGIASAALFTLMLAYHEFLLVRILTQSNWTLSVAIAQFIGGANIPGSIPLQSAAAVSATIPIALMVLIFQKQLVKGLTAGAVKG